MNILYAHANGVCKLIERSLEYIDQRCLLGPKVGYTKRHNHVLKSTDFQVTRYVKVRGAKFFFTVRKNRSTSANRV